MAEDHDYSLVCPFLTDDPLYALGVEFGMLYARMSRMKMGTIKDYFLLDNQEQVLLLASRLGWSVVKMRVWRKSWVFITLRK